MKSGARSFSEQVKHFLKLEDPQAEDGERRDRSPSAGAPDLPPDAPTDAEVQASWNETIMPMFDAHDGSCGCGDERCAGAC